jgi:hypothetical protein
LCSVNLEKQNEQFSFAKLGTSVGPVAHICQENPLWLICNAVKYSKVTVNATISTEVKKTGTIRLTKCGAYKLTLTLNMKPIYKMFCLQHILNAHKCFYYLHLSNMLSCFCFLLDYIGK